MPELALAIAKSEVRQAAQYAPDVMHRCARFLSVADQESAYPVIQLASQIAIEIAEAEILVVFGPRLFQLLAHAQAFRQPEMGLGVIGDDANRSPRGFDRLRVGRLQPIGLGQKIPRLAVILVPL